MPEMIVSTEVAKKFVALAETLTDMLDKKCEK